MDCMADLLLVFVWDKTAPETTNPHGRDLLKSVPQTLYLPLSGTRWVASCNTPYLCLLHLFTNPQHYIAITFKLVNNKKIIYLFLANLDMHQNIKIYHVWLKILILEEPCKFR